MFKDVIKKYVNIQYRRISSLRFVLFILVAMVVPATICAIMLPGRAENAALLLYRGSEHAKDATKKAILDWMGENSNMPAQVLTKIYNAAASTGNRDLILAICLVESNFNPHVESDKGAIGLMGIMPDIWMKELKEQGIIKEKEDLYGISGNIAAGAYVLASYLSETNDLRQALIRYVGGTSLYATKVLQVKKQISLGQYSEQQPAFASVQN